jgi:cytoskeletal protein CcmA (bactofilin family)
MGVAAALWLVLAGVAQAQEAGGHLVKTGTFAEDLYLAGERVEVDAEVLGDVLAAGRSVEVRGLVRGDVMAAGAGVGLRGEIGDDARLAGRVVLVTGRVGDMLLAAGQTVRVAPRAEIGGRTWLAGQHIEVGGRLGGDLRAAFERIVISGTVEGNVLLAGRDIEILPTARIRGNLTYWSRFPARIDPAARIEGRVVQERPRAGDLSWLSWTGLWLIVAGQFIVGGAALLLLFPRVTAAAAATLGREPVRSLVVGLAVGLLTPVVAVLSIMTAVGLQLGLAIVAAYFTFLLAGWLTAAFFVGDLGARFLGRGPVLSRGVRLASLAIAIVVLLLVRLVPFVGTLVIVLAVVAGIGAWTLCLYRRYRGREAANEPAEGTARA